MDGDEGDMACLSCAADRELFKNFTREEVKGKILRKLGMIAPPNVTAQAIPEHILNRLLNRFQREFEVQGVNSIDIKNLWPFSGLLSGPFSGRF